MIEGVLVGVLIGLGYGASLRYGLARALAAPSSYALALVQLGSFARLILAALGFALARRLLPGMNVAWGLGATITVILASMVRLARRGAKS